MNKISSSEICQKKKISIVTACYNVAKYLEDFFSSLIKQKLDFRSNIVVICVDDGSSDDTAVIIKQWQARYPENIFYHYQENAGQGAARNAGLDYVTTKWVTFVDPDDFLHENYCSQIDRYGNDPDVVLMNSRIVTCFEQEDIYRENHPLNYKFQSECRKKIVRDLGKDICLSASSSFFLADVINRLGLRFDSRIKPSFEDAFFVLSYLHNVPDKKVAFLRDALYFYRKRSTKDSTLDLAIKNEKRYIDQIKYGDLQALKRFANDGAYVKNYVLYDLIWIIRYLVNNPERLDFLSDDKQAEFFSLLREVFKYIPQGDILKFNLGECWFFYKYGMISCFKGQKLSSSAPQICYIDEYDQYKQAIRLYYFTSYTYNLEITVGDKQVEPSYVKIVENKFLKNSFCLTCYVWVSLRDLSSLKLSVRADNRPTIITFARKQYKSLDVSLIKEYYKTKGYEVLPSEAPWLFIDRLNLADDNAEHLYRWIKRNHPNRNIYFILDKESPHWERLAREGFDLVEFKSNRHKELAKACSKIISSHIDGYVINPFDDNTLIGKQVVFLQHGVTYNNLSRWLNTKKRIDLFCVTCRDEMAAIVSNGSPYKYSEKEVVLTGFARHDNLMRLSRVKRSERCILIMPSWRQYIFGNHLTSDDDKLEAFKRSSYANGWKNLLCSQEFKSFVEKYSFRVIFCGHPNVRPYVSTLNMPLFIEIDDGSSSVQLLFSRSQIMITDYSSIAFEMGKLRRPVVYYQFDKEEFYSNHTVQKGTWSFEKDGFGPVAHTVSDVIDELNGLVTPQEAKNSDFFAFNDEKNCLRIYQAICNLERRKFQNVPKINSPNKAKRYNAILLDEEVDLVPPSEIVVEPVLESEVSTYSDYQSNRTGPLIWVERLLVNKLVKSERLLRKYRRNRKGFFKDSKNIICKLYYRVIVND